MSETKKKKSYFVGPFKKAMDNVDAFSINMYYAYYYQNAIQNIIDMDEEEEEQHEETYDASSASFVMAMLTQCAA